MITTNMISLGIANIEWCVVQCDYKCSYVREEELTPLDKVICGILYYNVEPLLKEHVAYMMGFNSINDTSRNLYRDNSEWEIFCDAVKSLESYNLVDNDNDFISLTPRGKVAFVNKKKNKYCEESFVLWDDKLRIGSSVKCLIPYLKNVDEKGQTVQDLFVNPKELLFSQYPDFRGENIEEMTLEKRTAYSAKVPFNIYYDISSMEIFLEMDNIVTSEDLDAVQSVILSNDKIKTNVLSSFFDKFPVSIINKPIFQLSMENMPINSNRSIYGLNDIFNYIYENDDANEVFFFFDTLNDEYITALINLAAKKPYTLFFIGYRSSEFINLINSENNIYFHNETTFFSEDICILKENSYFSKRNIVVSFNEVEYTIPAYIHETESKYKIDVIRSIYAEYIVTQFGDYCVTQIDNENHSVNRKKGLIKLSEYISKYIIDENSDNLENLDNKILLFKSKWIDDLKASVETIGHQEAQSRLQKIKSECSGIFEDEFTNFIKEIQNLIDEKHIEPKKGKKIAYILDTNVLLDMPEILDRFDRKFERIFIPGAMYDEIDNHSHNEKLKTKALPAIKAITRYREEYPHILNICLDINLSLIPNGISRDKNDHQMLALMIELSNQEIYEKVIIVSNDVPFNTIVKQYIQDYDTEGVMGTQSLSEFINDREYYEEVDKVGNSDNIENKKEEIFKKLCDILGDCSVIYSDKIISNATVTKLGKDNVCIITDDGNSKFCYLNKIIGLKTLDSLNNIVNQRVYACLSKSGKNIYCIILEMTYESLLGIIKNLLCDITKNYPHISYIMRYLKKTMNTRMRRDIINLRKEIKELCQDSSLDVDEEDDD